MIPKPVDNKAGRELASIAEDIFDSLAKRFPVCMSSDEFHYFPQAGAVDFIWSRWDDFSEDGVGKTVAQITDWKARLLQLSQKPHSAAVAIEISMLARILTTLGEQLQAVRFQLNQPTFYLTIAAIGLAESLEGDKAFFIQRLGRLPHFLRQMQANLQRIPALFRDLGLEMTEKIRGWLTSLSGMTPECTPAAAALNRLADYLKQVATTDDFRLPPDLYERIAKDHIGCGMTLDEIRNELEQEIAETEEILEREAHRMFPGRSWREAVSLLPPPRLPRDGPLGLYRSIIEKLGTHCAEVGLMPLSDLQTCPVRVEPVPEYLSPVRSAAAYSMPPGYPPSGGTFYIMGDEGRNDIPRDYLLLTAHETFPGHHLLDTSRWSLERSIRRHIEFPLFYEGWASFSEELLFDTGFLGDPRDYLLLAKRRYWRAVRGRIDLDIQSGERTLSEAAAFLRRAGIGKRRAGAMVRRYALKPGYQLSYTIGRRKFRDMYQAYVHEGNTTADFVRAVLAEGEIGLDNLRRVVL
jgi:uncharacterized protein (DUF885 family)